MQGSVQYFKNIQYSDATIQIREYDMKLLQPIINIFLPSEKASFLMPSPVLVSISISAFSLYRNENYMCIHTFNSNIIVPLISSTMQIPDQSQYPDDC